MTLPVALFIVIFLLATAAVICLALGLIEFAREDRNLEEPRRIRTGLGVELIDLNRGRNRLLAWGFALFLLCLVLLLGLGAYVLLGTA